MVYVEGTSQIGGHALQTDSVCQEDLSFGTRIMGSHV